MLGPPQPPRPPEAGKRAQAGSQRAVTVARRFATALQPADLGNPEFAFHAGVSALSRRRFGRAAQLLATAQAAPGRHARAFGYRVYALCLDGRLDEARELLAARRHALNGNAPLWALLQRLPMG